jgi:hypothetical protein
MGLPAAARAHFVIVGGLGGEARYAKSFAKHIQELDEICATNAGDRSLVYSLSGKGATREAIEDVFDRLRSQTGPGDTVAVFLIGHGSYDGREDKFNIPGPDLNDLRLKELLDSLPAKDQLLVITTSSSGAVLEHLKADRRVVITATKSGGERTVTVFARYWVEALREPEADTNKDEVITALEAFQYADRQVQDYYKSDQKLATEHARLEGKTAAGFTLARLGSARDVAANPELRPLLDERGRLERAIAELKGRKDSMDAAQYATELQTLLVELARTQAKIDQAAGKPQESEEP